MQLTEKQQLAVDIRDKNILVSAAAGSGKTAVLVKRIIDRVLDENNPVDIDRILVMTFTKAAAAQMKDRILKAIEEKRAVKPFDKNLQKQAALVHSANITTIDSFCMMVVRNHFAEIDLNPDFRMADEGETNLLKRDAVDEVLEQLFAEGSDDFLNMTECFASGKSDAAIDELILKMHTFSESYVDPCEWLDGCANKYSLTDVEAIDEQDYIIEYVNNAKKYLKEAINSLEEALSICQKEFGPLPYTEAIESDIDYVTGVIKKDCYSEMYEYFESVGKYSGKRLATYTMPKNAIAEEIEIRNELKEHVKTLRAKAKVLIEEVANTVCDNSPSLILDSMHEMELPIKELIRATKMFKNRFADKKKDKNLVDFNDLEHMCLEILRTSESASKEYRDFFEEIYVDEYQDSNLVQEEILSFLTKNDETSGNLFMVGDVKQSIYGFRLARPDIFIEKYSRFPDKLSSGPDIKIDLHDNFRSRSTVVDSVNEIFRKTMTKDTGKLDYDVNAELHAKAEYCDGMGYETELVLCVKDNEINPREMEARAVANKIKELVGTLDVKDGDNGIRKAKYSDVVILLRTAKGWDNLFMNTLESEGIPVHVTSTSGYFSQKEVATLLEYLKIIDNPLQDIPMMAALRSSFGLLYDEEVAMIRGAFPEGYLYESILKFRDTYIDTDGYEVIISKIQSFLDTLNYYRKKTTYTPVDKIIAEIIDRTYGRYVNAEVNGAKKMANLNVLLNKAIEYGKSSYKGLFHFNRYIEMLHKYEVDFGEANTLDENDDAVRIMSIHKSKGLEFPICFVCGMSKKFNVQDLRADVILDADWGAGVNVVNPKRRTKYKSLFKTSLAIKKAYELIEEEQRLFYVAMTRAKEKLIMTAQVKDEKQLTGAGLIIPKCSSYLDFYLFANSKEEISSIKVSYVEIADLVGEEMKHAIKEMAGREEFELLLNEKTFELPAKIRQRMEYVYPYEETKGAVKVSVSELKRRSMMIKMQEDEENNSPEIELINDATNYDDDNSLSDEIEEIIPSFMRNEEEVGEKTYSPALRGTAVHRIFELWDYTRETDIESVKSYIAKVREDKRIEEDLYELINPKVLYNFVNSSIASRMKTASLRDKLRREQPFVIEDPDTGMLIQGIIDAYFVEDGEIVVVDYKTDRAKGGDELVTKYRVQLDYYAKALSMLTGLKIREKVIYSTYLNECIIM